MQELSGPSLAPAQLVLVLGLFQFVLVLVLVLVLGRFLTEARRIGSTGRLTEEHLPI
jgi:hypothetical protein